MLSAYEQVRASFESEYRRSYPMRSTERIGDKFVDPLVEAAWIGYAMGQIALAKEVSLAVFKEGHPTLGAGPNSSLEAAKIESLAEELGNGRSTSGSWLFRPASLLNYARAIFALASPGAAAGALLNGVDAARYRWLRTRFRYDHINHGENGYHYDSDPIPGDDIEFDDAVDIARGAPPLAVDSDAVSLAARRFALCVEVCHQESNEHGDFVQVQLPTPAGVFSSTAECFVAAIDNKIAEYARS